MSFKDQLHIFSSDETTEALLSWWQERTAHFSQDHRPVSWALSGGKTPLGFYKKLAQSEVIDWNLLQVFLVDERDVTPDHPDSNYHLCMSAGLGAKLQKDQFPSMRTNPFSLKETPIYEGLIRKLPQSSLDIVLLGMGADGHTASLFPGTIEADQKLDKPFTADDPLVISHELPTQPLSSLSSKWRSTLTYKALSQAREVVFLITGQDKAERLYEIFHTSSQAPCAKVWKLRQKLGLPTHWYFDEAAASFLK